MEYVQQCLPYFAQQVDLCGGLSGLSWLLEYFNQRQGDDYDGQMCESLDQMLLELVRTKPWSGEIEMVYGLAGVLVYASRRGRYGQAGELLKVLVDFYQQTAIELSGGLSWSQPLNSAFRYDKTGADEFNLGLAHGVVGIIAALLSGLDCGDCRAHISLLLSKSCDWLIQQHHVQPERLSYFATCAGESGYSRLGWCYGDLTIALTLARVGDALQRRDYIEFAQQVALAGAKRQVSEAMVKDAGFCHGSAGLALIFKKLYQQFNDDALLEATHFWLNYTLDLYRQDGLTGLNMYDVSSKRYVDNQGLLMGDSGVGLCLLSLLCDEDDWLDCVLLG